ncbi:MAG: hypothetical protein JXA20_01015 [Spirochaetes bacterium]|nr:hypothetical protein [Spirochaetota bacterium]
MAIFSGGKIYAWPDGVDEVIPDLIQMTKTFRETMGGYDGSDIKGAGGIALTAPADGRNRSLTGARPTRSMNGTETAA